MVHTLAGHQLGSQGAVASLLAHEACVAGAVAPGRSLPELRKADVELKAVHTDLKAADLQHYASMHPRF